VWGIYLTWVSIGIALISFLYSIAANRKIKKTKVELDGLSDLVKNNQALLKLETEKTKPLIHIVEKTGKDKKNIFVTLRNDGPKCFVVSLRTSPGFWFTEFEESFLLNTGQIHAFKVSYEKEAKGGHQLFKMLVRDSIGVMFIQKCQIMFRIDGSYELYLGQRLENENIQELMEAEW